MPFCVPGDVVVWPVLEIQKNGSWWFRADSFPAPTVPAFNPLIKLNFALHCLRLNQALLYSTYPKIGHVWSEPCLGKFIGRSFPPTPFSPLYSMSPPRK